MMDEQCFIQPMIFFKNIMVYNLKYSNNKIAKLLACFPCLKNAKNLEILGFKPIP